MAVNARDAMDGEGQLTISISAATGEDGSDIVCVRVTDTGHGMSPDQLERIFEPFFTTKEVGKGTGLGLSQVYGFVKQSDGEVSVESTVGEGTSFTIRLPRVSAAKVNAQPVSEIEDDHRHGGRVLVVEDNVDVGEFASQILTDLGFETMLVADPKSALECLATEDGKFDLVFSDVVMPGMDGVEFGRIVRQKWPTIPVVLTSGYSHVLADEPQHGFPLLQKPYSVEALSKTLREAREASTFH
jgi:CheY-like chemotaxis protein